MQVFVTNYNERYIVGLVAGIKQVLEGEVYQRPTPFWNEQEKRKLLGYKEFCKNHHALLEELVARIANSRDSHLLPNNPPAFHSESDCNRANAEYNNFEIPDEIKRRGSAEVERFVLWFRDKYRENPNYGTNALLLDSLLIRSMLEFKLSEKPKPLTLANSGVIPLSAMLLSELEKLINELLDQEEEFTNQSQGHTRLIRDHGAHSYNYTQPDATPGFLLGAFSCNVSYGMQQKEAMEILRQFEIQFKLPLQKYLRAYYRSKYNPGGRYDGQLLQQIGFVPCRACL